MTNFGMATFWDVAAIWILAENDYVFLRFNRRLLPSLQWALSLTIMDWMSVKTEKIVQWSRKGKTEKSENKKKWKLK